MTNQAKVGIFAAIIIAIFILGFYFLKGVDLFESKNVYYAVYDRVDGLYKSNLVEINGFPIGRVGDMARDPKTGKIVVQLILNKDIKVPNSDSTLAMLVSTDLLGTKLVSLEFGETDEVMKPGDTIGTEFQKDISEQAGPLIDEVKLAIPKADTSLASVNWMLNEKNPNGIYSTINGINRVLGHIDNILVTDEQGINLTVKNLQGITENLQKNNAAISEIIKNAASITDSLKQANLKQLVENLNHTAVELHAITSSINSGQGTLGSLIKSKELYQHLDSTVNSMNALLKDVKARPYRYVNGINVLGGKKRDQRIAKEDNESNQK